jgi:hypothetical protein
LWKTFFVCQSQALLMCAWVADVLPCWLSIFLWTQQIQNIWLVVAVSYHSWHWWSWVILSAFEFNIERIMLAKTVFMYFTVSPCISIHYI